MPWPNPQDYNEAVQNPRLCFNDPELQEGRAVTSNLGLPMPRSGNFADVYEFNCPSSRHKWAIKCFTREIPGLRERYSAISAFLKPLSLSFMVDFHYLEPGIKVGAAWYPVIKMHWIEGQLLHEYVRDNVDEPRAMERLGQIWLIIARKLHQAGVAHGDLQHGNILVGSGHQAASVGVRLIDYDGMLVPALADKPSHELGHPSYQHPERSRARLYRVEVDRFSHLVIYTALRALKVGGRRLWDRFNNGDNLLFRPQDLETPDRSELFAELYRLNNPDVRKLAGNLALAAREPLTRTPLLDDLLEHRETPGIDQHTTTGVMPARWFFVHDGKAYGPVTNDQLRQVAFAGILGPNDLIWPEGVEPQHAAPAHAMIDIVELCNPTVTPRATPKPRAEPLVSVPASSSSVALPDWLNDVQQLESPAVRHHIPQKRTTGPLPKWLDDIRRLEETS
jgi:serine/threonine protein kinase